VLLYLSLRGEVGKHNPYISITGFLGFIHHSLVFQTEHNVSETKPVSAKGKKVRRLGVLDRTNHNNWTMMDPTE
jgi:hypothetical protein